MTMVDERTRSVVQAGEFLAGIVKDTALPDFIRNEAKRLLRHYPSAHEVWLAGRLELLRQNEILQLSTTPVPLPAVLLTWPLCEPFFSDPQDKM
jgi:hypothetical protein